MVGRVKIPVVAIGGITAENVALVVQAGAAAAVSIAGILNNSDVVACEAAQLGSQEASGVFIVIRAEFLVGLCIQLLLAKVPRCPCSSPRPSSQWVLSLPAHVRRLAAWDRKLSATIVTVLAAQVGLIRIRFFVGSAGATGRCAANVLVAFDGHATAALGTAVVVAAEVGFRKHA